LKGGNLDADTGEGTGREDSDLGSSKGRRRVTNLEQRMTRKKQGNVEVRILEMYHNTWRGQANEETWRGCKKE
jgi:hypothetical protein